MFRNSFYLVLVVTLIVHTHVVESRSLSHRLATNSDARILQAELKDSYSSRSEPSHADKVLISSASFASSEATAVLQTRTQATIFPTAKLTDANAARRILRGNKDPASILANLYVLEQQSPFNNAYVGRVLGCAFTVQRKDRENYLTAAEYMTAMLFNPNPPQGAPNFYVQGQQGSLIKSIYNVGHIRGSTLGGSDEDPLNFFPLHYQSNFNNGRWYRAEMIASSVNQDFLDIVGDYGVKKRGTIQGLITRKTNQGILDTDPEKAALIAKWNAFNALITKGNDAGRNSVECPVEVKIAFKYSFTNPWLASHGTYSISTTSNCYELLKLCRFDLDDYSKAFVDHAQASLFGKFRTLTTDWRNQADIAIKTAPTSLDTNTFIVATNLYPLSN